MGVQWTRELLYQIVTDIYNGLTPKHAVRNHNLNVDAYRVSTVMRSYNIGVRSIRALKRQGKTIDEIFENCTRGDEDVSRGTIWLPHEIYYAIDLIRQKKSPHEIDTALVYRTYGGLLRYLDRKGLPLHVLRKQFKQGATTNQIVENLGIRV